MTITSQLPSSTPHKAIRLLNFRWQYGNSLKIYEVIILLTSYNFVNNIYFVIGFLLFCNHFTKDTSMSEIQILCDVIHELWSTVFNLFCTSPKFDFLSIHTTKNPGSVNGNTYIHKKSYKHVCSGNVKIVSLNTSTQQHVSRLL